MDDDESNTRLSNKEVNVDISPKSPRKDSMNVDNNMKDQPYLEMVPWNLVMGKPSRQAQQRASRKEREPI